MKTQTALLAFLAAAAPLHAREEQSHGLLFERRVIDQLLGRSYTDTWDIPAAANSFDPGRPCSVKFGRWGDPVMFGDAQTQCAIAIPFAIVAGFYEPSDDQRSARLRAIHYVKIEPEQWRKLWGAVTPEDLARLGALAKAGAVEQAQTAAGDEARRLRSLTGGFDINPKINGDQRRIQCSLPFALFYKAFLGQAKPVPQKILRLWNRPFPNQIPLGPRAAAE